MTDQPWGMTINELVEGLEEIAENKEHEKMLKRIDESHKRDYDGSRRKYADEVSTATALVRRAKAA